MKDNFREFGVKNTTFMYQSFDKYYQNGGGDMKNYSYEPKFRKEY